MDTENKPQEPRFTIERHGNGWAIYRGRDHQHHGWNLGHLTECGEDTIRLIESSLNAASVKVMADGQIEWEGKVAPTFTHLYFMTGARDLYKMRFEQAQPLVERMQRRIEELTAAEAAVPTAAEILSGLRRLALECRAEEGQKGDSVAMRVEAMIRTMEGRTQAR